MNKYVVKAIHLSALWLSDKKRLCGESAISHCSRVANRVDPLTEEDNWALRVVALLHDVVEDSNCTLKDIDRIFPKHIVTAVEAITRITGENYYVYLTRILRNSLSTQVKLADLYDNITRFDKIKNPTQKDVARLTKYGNAVLTLRGCRLEA